MFKNNNIIIVAHKFLTQPDDGLVVYLNSRRYDNIFHIMHSFSDASDRCSYYRWYRHGNLYKEQSTRDYGFWPEPVLYLKEIMMTLWWVFSSNIKWDTYIGMDGLCTLCGNVLRSLLKVKNTIYWAIDFVPKDRFERGWKNWIYQAINNFGYRSSDAMWDLSPRMAEARDFFFGIEANNYQHHRIVPYGMWTDQLKPRSYTECEKNTLVFMGHLIEKQGVQLVLKAMPEILKKRQNFIFKVIGAGNYYTQLINLARDLGVESNCRFIGKINDIHELEEEIAKSCVAIAPYISSLDKWTYYADPGKVKTYIACGVPVMLTDLPWNAQEIEKFKCGVIIQEKTNDILDKLFFLLDEDNNQFYRNNTSKYSNSFDYKTIFDNLFVEGELL